MSFYSEFAAHYERIFPFRAATHAFLAGHLAPGARRVLDLGCGTGDYCGRFAADGHLAVGIDLDPQMIAAASARYPRARFACLDLRAVSRFPETFDLACCIGNTLAHVPPPDLPAFLAALRARLAPGARWIFQVLNWDAILERGTHVFPVIRLDAGAIAFHREYRDISERRVRFLTRLEIDGAVRFAGEVELYPVRAGVYEQLHAAASFHCLGHYGGFTETPFAPGAAASVFVFEPA
jgi:SAM-dependent methyltransferase